MSTRTTGASHIYVILYVKWIEIYIYINHRFVGLTETDQLVTHICGGD